MYSWMSFDKYIHLGNHNLSEDADNAACALLQSAGLSTLLLRRELVCRDKLVLCALCACSVVQSCPTLCDSVDCSPPGSAIHGIFQAEMLEWVAFFFSRGSSQPQDWTPISCISYAGRWILYHWATWEALLHLQKWESCVLQFWYVFFLCLDFWLRILRLNNSYCIHQWFTPFYCWGIFHYKYKL